MANSKARLSKRVIDNIEPNQIVWDSDVGGFGARRLASKTIYILKYRYHRRQRWVTIGTHGAITPQAARAEAQRLIGLVRSGIDVAGKREEARAAPSVADLCARYLEEHAEQHKAASSVRMDRANIENHVLPLIGRMALADITRSDVDALKRAVRDGKTARRENRDRDGYRGGALVTGGTGVANRVLALLSKMFNLAEVWGWRPEYSNPVRLVAKYPENKRQRFLSEAETIRLATVLDELEGAGQEDIYVIAALRMLLLTGARLGEILNLTWREVDIERRMLMLEHSKTGPRPIFLNDAALAILQAIPRKPGNEFVMAGRRDGRPLVNLQKPWGRIRAAANLDDLRIHDLRHSFASMAAANGASLPMIGALLGHTNPQTTQRYAHLANDPIRELNNTVGSKLGKLLKG